MFFVSFFHEELSISLYSLLKSSLSSLQIKKEKTEAPRLVILFQNLKQYHNNYNYLNEKQYNIDAGCSFTYTPYIDSVAGMALIKATRILLLEALTPQCHSLHHPGACSALETDGVRTNLQKR